ncbi:hypothetical protein [Streptomyces sp. URMC 123]|uniref:hypothetical protein n=1 Tax=Streptomyces sp. URMC 123 TaxID=3423403 RepID=UPI003F1C7E27
MGTDVYGCVEVRNPSADEDWYEWPPWVRAMDLYPLYEQQDYASLGCLFGVRNAAGWDPIAAGRGLPPDVSPAFEEEFERTRALDPAVHSPTWVTWAELSEVDMDATPRGTRGALVLRDTRSPAREDRYWIADAWPPAVVNRLGPSLADGRPADTPYGTWTVGTTQVTYRRFTRRDAIGPGTGWDHVFAVMRALAPRFGPDGVRLVVYFD